MRRAAYLTPGADLGTGVELARRAETLGYESAWVTHGLARDSFVVLGAYAAATTRLRLGNGVVPIYPRHPVAMAQAALTLAELSGGRFTLGIGVSHRASMEQMLGLALTDPIAVMREYVSVLRGALAGAVAFEGAYFRVKWTLGLPARPAPPPLYLAALSPSMLETAGEVADGVVLWLCPPAYVRDGDRLVLADPVTTGYRMPTEAEWEFASRFDGSRATRKYPWGNNLPVPAKSGNWGDAAAIYLTPVTITGYDDGYRVAAPVGSFAPNPLGLYDMGSNVFEWTTDRYSIYVVGPDFLSTDPVGPKTGDNYVIRGASWLTGKVPELRLAARDSGNTARPDLGFRIARYAE